MTAYDVLSAVLTGNYYRSVSQTSTLKVVLSTAPSGSVFMMAPLISSLLARMHPKVRENDDKRDGA